MGVRCGIHGTGDCLVCETETVSKEKVLERLDSVIRFWESGSHGFSEPFRLGTLSAYTRVRAFVNGDPESIC